MRHSVSRPHPPRRLGRLVSRRPALRLPAAPDDFPTLGELPGRAEALAESAMPYLDRARGRRPERRRGRGRLVLVCLVLAALGAAAAWAAWQRRRDDEYARLVAEPERPRDWPAAGGPSAPSGPAEPASSPDRSAEPSTPSAGVNVAMQPARDPVTASAGQAARARAQTGPALPATPSPSQYLRSHRTELPPVPGSRPPLPR